MDKFNKLIKNMNRTTLTSNYTTNSIDSEANKFMDSNTKLTESNYSNKIRSLNGEKTFGKRNMKNLAYKSKNNLKINIKNLSNTDYDGFYHNKKSKCVYTLPTIDI
jgi:hypothetical protein